MNLVYLFAAWIVGAGVGLAFALVWLGRQARRRDRLNEVMALREPLQRDPLGTLAKAADWLPTLGLPGLAWDGHWYGAPLQGGVGKPWQATAGVEHTVRFDEVQLRLRVSLAGLRGESALLADRTAQLLFVVVDGALAARELALLGVTAQRARMAVFVQHDMRNLAQWVALTAESLQAADQDPALLRVARRLRDSAGLAQQRARRLSEAMLSDPGHAHPELEASSPWDWRAHLKHAALQHQVTLTMQGEGPPRLLRWSASAWDTLVDNLLGNVSRLARGRLEAARCDIRVTQEAGGTWSWTFDSPGLALDLPLERVFEPWVGGQPGRTGLGLYQARKAVQSAGGLLRAEAAGAGLRLVLRLPSSAGVV